MALQRRERALAERQKILDDFRRSGRAEMTAEARFRFDEATSHLDNAGTDLSNADSDLSYARQHRYQEQGNVASLKKQIRDRNIDKDGKITGADSGLLVTTGEDGVIGAAASIVPNDLATTFDDDAGYLSNILGTFDYDSAKSQFTLSTDKLKYKDTGTDTHSGDCLLKVDNTGYVSHDGNASYNALYDLKTNHFDSTSKANDGKGEIALKYTALALKTDETLDANATKGVVFKGASLAATAGKAELADVAVLAPKTGDENQSADNAPKADAVPADSESDAAKIVRVGTSSYAARADHVHPVCTEMGNEEKETMTNSDSWVPAAGKKTDTWTPGDKGFTESYCSRVYKASGYSYFIFRTRKVSKTGAVVYRGPEYCMFCVSNE